MCEFVTLPHDTRYDRLEFEVLGNATLDHGVHSAAGGVDDTRVEIDGKTTIERLELGRGGRGGEEGLVCVGVGIGGTEEGEELGDGERTVDASVVVVDIQVKDLLSSPRQCSTLSLTLPAH